MRFAIRDDDTNFFTTPEEIENCYSNIWQDMPVSLCLISKVKGNWKQWVHEIYRQKQATDWNSWVKDDTPYPIENNTDLIYFLKKKLKEGKIDIAFHAKYHRNGDDILPADKPNNYIRGAEFYTNQDLTYYIQKELQHLEQIFEYPITVFTPPQNLLSVKGYKSVINAGLNICGGGITFYKKSKDIKGLTNIWKQAYFKLLNKGCNYPYTLRYSDHTEIPYHYPLQPNTQLRTLIDAFEMVRRFDGDFVLSTHYVEFNYPMTYNEKITMKNVLDEFLHYISKYTVEKVSLSHLLK